MSAMSGLWNVKTVINKMCAPDNLCRLKKNQALDTFYLKENSEKKMGKITSPSFKIRPFQHCKSQYEKFCFQNTKCKKVNISI